MRRSLAAILFCISFDPVLAEAAPEWQGHSGQWCLVEGKSRMCLPASFSALRLGVDYADFEISDPRDRPNVFLKFVYLGGLGQKEVLNLAEENVAFVLEETKTIGNATVSWFSIGCNDASELCMTTIVMQVAGKFALQMAGGANDEISNLAIRMANEWSSQTRPVSK